MLYYTRGKEWETNKKIKSFPLKPLTIDHKSQVKTTLKLKKGGDTRCTVQNISSQPLKPTDNQGGIKGEFRLIFQICNQPFKPQLQQIEC